MIRSTPMRLTRAVRTTTFTAAAALAVTVLGAPAASAGGYDDGVTTVTLNPEVVPILVDDLAVAPVKPATITPKGGTAVASFPITDVDEDEVGHAGGLRFTTVGGGSLRITEFEVELEEGVLDAKTRLNGARVGEVDIFDLGATKTINGKKTACDGIAAGLYLTHEAAGALGAPQYEGAFIGNACVQPGS
jgi:hypothetical protein